MLVYETILFDLISLSLSVLFAFVMEYSKTQVFAHVLAWRNTWLKVTLTLWAQAATKIQPSNFPTIQFSVCRISGGQRIFNDFARDCVVFSFV